MKPNTSSSLLATSLIASVLLLLVGSPSCGPTDVITFDAPEILGLSIESTNVTPGLTISLEVEATGAGNLSYLWEAEGDEGAAGGEFTDTTTASTAWTAPFEMGSVLVRVTVTDARGGSASRAFPILVGPGEDGDADGFAVVEGDCDDEDPTIYPGAPEAADGIDNDCDGEVDEGSDDTDDDGDGFSDLQGDCDDNDPNVYPGAPEAVNGVDENCNTLIDDGTEAFDDDGDGFSEQDGDCNDANEAIGPAATELLDSVDNDCDGVVDETTVGYDDDGDGFTELAGDCDDGDTDTYPAAPELPDGEDNDCNGQIDDGSLISDDDGDGYTGLAGDCDDTNPYTYPGAPEYLDGADNDCDGTPDEDLDTTDDDGDGFAESAGDCNDGNDQIYPGALELDDGIDNDCDGFGYTNPPTASAIVVGQAEACSAVNLSGVNSFDPDGDTLDFTWFFSTQPPASVLTDDDLVERFAMDSNFVPDTAGYWAVALQVTDGTYSSAPATVGFTVNERENNADPVASFAHGNLVDSGSSSCTTDSYGNCNGCDPCAASLLVDATASIDPDGDPIWYEFAASHTGGDGLPPTITNNGDGTGTLTFDMNRTCTMNASGVYEVDVEVKDCNGATSSSTVQVSYTCG